MRSCPSRFLDPGLLALHQEVEVGQHTPFLKRSDLLNDSLSDLPGEREQLRSGDRVVPQDNLEENPDSPFQSVHQRRRDAHHLRRQCHLRDCRKELRLMGKGSRDVHSPLSGVFA